MWPALAGKAAPWILLALVAFLYKGELKHSAAVEADLAGANATIKFKDDTAGMSQDHADKYAALTREVTGQIEGAINERSLEWAALSRQALESPYDHGNRIEYELARVFCLWEAGNDRATRSTCYLSNPEAYDPQIAITQTINPDWAERLAEQCDDTGERDFCEWASTGFNAGGLKIILDHLDKMDAKQVELLDEIDKQRAMVDRLEELAAATAK